MTWKSKLFIISALTSVFGLFLPYPISLVVVSVSAVSLFLSMGMSTFVVATLVIGFISLSPFLIRVAASELYYDIFFGDHANYLERSGETKTISRTTRIPKVKSLTVDGINLKVEVKKDATEITLSGRMKINPQGEYLRVRSSGFGKVISGDLENLEINGMGVIVVGDGDVRNLEINGIDSSVDLSNLKTLDLEINGMRNSLDLVIHKSAWVEINGMSNEIKVTFTKDSSGEASFNVNGAGNDIKIYIQKGSKIHVNSKPSFFNSVRVFKIK